MTIEEFWALCLQYEFTYGYRTGQAFMNVLASHRSDLDVRLRREGGLDPYYADEGLLEATLWVRTHWGDAPPEPEPMPGWVYYNNGGSTAVDYAYVTNTTNANIAYTTVPE